MNIPKYVIKNSKFTAKMWLIIVKYFITRNKLQTYRNTQYLDFLQN